MQKIQTLSSHSLLFLWLGVVSGCATIDLTIPKDPSRVLESEVTANTRLGKVIELWNESHKGMSAFYPLDNGLDALGIRLGLAANAEKSLDVQTFLMKDDTASLVMMSAFLEAADRGVRVRFLLDDIFTTAKDENLLLLSQHPNIEIRLFNPISRKGISNLNFLGDFRSANRRMHNKSFTVDNSVSVVGGRNIADEYFQLNVDNMFTDFDVIAAGSVAEDVTSLFDEFWNDQLSVPVEHVIQGSYDTTLAEVREQYQDELSRNYTNLYRQARQSELLQRLVSEEGIYYPAEASLLADAPDDLRKSSSNSPMQLTAQIKEVLEGAQSEVILITPYFVPGKDGVVLLRKLVDSGVSVKLITNSLASNNHIPVQSAYNRYRKDVINSGVDVYEINAFAARVIDASEEAPETMTLHTKAVLIDRRFLFAGSLNLDPRSTQINTEMGLLIDSPDMVRGLVERLVRVLPKVTYKVVLNDKNNLEWHTINEDVLQVLHKEPHTSAWLRFKAWFMRIAPENQM